MDPFKPTVEEKKFENIFKCKLHIVGMMWRAYICVRPIKGKSVCRREWKLKILTIHISKELGLNKKKFKNINLSKTSFCTSKYVEAPPNF